MAGEPDDEPSMNRGDRMALARKPHDLMHDEIEAWFNPAQVLTEDDRAYRILEHLGITDWSHDNVSYITEHLREHLAQAMSEPIGGDEDMDLGDPFGEGPEPEPYPIQRQPREED
jgi:hypothetical protein